MVIRLAESRLTMNDRLTREIRAWMARRDLTQTALAAAIGQPPHWLNKRLHGHVPLTVNEAASLARALGVPLSVLIDGQPLPHLDSNQEPAGSGTKNGNPWVTGRARYDSRIVAEKAQNLRSAA